MTDWRADDVLVYSKDRQKYRIVAVQRFGDGMKGRWFTSVRECLSA